MTANLPESKIKTFFLISTCYAIRFIDLNITLLVGTGKRYCDDNTENARGCGNSVLQTSVKPR